MSAGYLIYSLDWNKFRLLVEQPTPEQLMTLAQLLRDGLDEYEGQFDGDDPLSNWPTDVTSLTRIAAQRLARSDWYGDLSRSGKELWEGVIFRACMDSEEGEYAIDVGFRNDSEGIYWDVIEIAWKNLGVPPATITNVALSAFGTRPFRYQPQVKKRGLFFRVEDGDEWTPMHSIHTPDEVAAMQAELLSVEPHMKAARKENVWQEYEEVLMPAIENTSRDQRMLFIQVDT